MNTAAWTPTDDAVQWAIGLLESAQCVANPAHRAQLLAQAQHQLTWALRLAAKEAVDGGTSWRRLGPKLGMSHAVLYRQVRSGGPVVATEAHYTPPEVVVGYRTVGDLNDSWRVISADQAADPQLTMTTVTMPSPGGDDVRVQLAHRPPTAPDLLLANLAPAQPLWRPEMGRRLMLLTPPVFEGLYGPRDGEGYHRWHAEQEKCWHWRQQQRPAGRVGARG